jgi:DHA2 family multidrug resistance protein-like MFS transporter
MLNAPDEKAGMAASIEEVAYELGSVLGVTFMGGLMSAVYTAKLVLPAGFTVADKVYDSLDEALIVAEGLPQDSASLLVNQASMAFDNAFMSVMIATIIVLVVSIVVLPFFFRQKRTV